MRWICFLSLAAVGCVKPPFTSPLDGGAPWRELTSEHFTLQTDSSADRARDLVAELERSFALLQQVAFDYRPPLTLRVRVVNFDGLTNLEEFGLPNAAGLARDGGDGFRQRQVILLTDSQRRLVTEKVQHELTHRFVAFYTPAVPLWLNEGLAEYYSTMTFEAGAAVVGEHLGDRTFTSNSWGLVGVDGAGYVGIPATAVPSAAALRSMGPGEFYSKSEAEDDQLACLARYAGAWALVQTLFLEPNGPRRFKGYFDDLFHASVKEPEAWQAHFGDLEQTKLQSDFGHFMHGDAFSGTWRLPLTVRAPAAPQERAMSASEVHTLWAEQREPTDAKTARDLQRAIEADPHNPEAYLQRAFQAEAKHAARAVIERDVNRAYQLAPDNPRFLLAKAKLEWESARREQRPMSRVWVSLLANRPTGAPELTFLAYDALDRQRLGAAQHYARKALAADPSACYCYVAASRVAAARLDYRFAADALRTALNLVADGALPSDLERELAEYEALARAPTASPSSPP